MTEQDLIDGIKAEFGYTPTTDDINHISEWLYDCTYEDIETLDFFEMRDRIEDALIDSKMEWF